MTGTRRVVFLDRHAPAVQSLIRRGAPGWAELEFVTGTESPAERRQLLAEAELVVGGIDPVTADDIAAAGRLVIIQKWGVGVDKIDLDAARAARVSVAITAGAAAVTVAEHVVLLTLAALRRLPELLISSDGSWSETRAIARTGSRELAGRMVGLVGLGRIGREVARRMTAFGARVAYHDLRRAGPEDERVLGLTPMTLDELLAEADVVSLHVPLVPETRGLIDGPALARMKPGAILVNTARGGLIDETALVAALEAGRLGGAALDVLSAEPPERHHPLLGHPQVVVTPHVAGSSLDGVDRYVDQIFRNLGLAVSGRPIPAEDVVVRGRGQDAGPA